jgi:hypothetical protein
MLNLVTILVLLPDSSLLLLDLLLSSLNFVSQCQLVQGGESKKSLKVVINEKQEGSGMWPMISKENRSNLKSLTKLV